ncbi:uncharacterized protein [Nicotiana tomentosiformis]|uniref:uncharacterized protein n=1 Tax=Nicotiana tomentosiformis TaxID=4098 RepID=UPI00388CE8A3
MDQTNTTESLPRRSGKLSKQHMKEQLKSSSQRSTCSPLSITLQDDESIQDMHTRFTSIINEIHSLGEIIPRNKLVTKILSVLPGSWESKVNAITKAKDLQKLTSGEDAGMTYLTKRFQKMSGHFIKDYPLLKQDQYKHNTDKTVKRNPIPHKRFKRKDVADNVVKQALAAWGDSSSESGEDDEQGDTSMMAVESEAAEYDSIFALMAKSDDDEDDDDDDEEAVKGNSQKWYMDSGCSKYMTGNIDDFLSLKALQGGSVSFGNGKNGYILGVERIGKTPTHSVENVYYVNGLKYSLPRHVRFSLLNKLVKKDLVCGLPKSRFKDHNVCDAGVRGKRVRSSFKTKNEVSTSRPLDLLHMDLCRPMRVPGRGGKKYIFVIVDDYSRFTWTLFLRTNDETFPVFVAFVKQIQVNISHNIVSIRYDHGTEFDNVKFDEFYVKNGISHNFSAPRTPQQNGVMERKNRTLEDMARTMIIDSGVTKGFWAEAVNTTCYLVNRCMIRSLLNKTPYEWLNGRKPNLTHLRTFGCKCSVLNNGKEALGNLTPKVMKESFLDIPHKAKHTRSTTKGLNVLKKVYM